MKLTKTKLFELITSDVKNYYLQTDFDTYKIVKIENNKIYLEYIEDSNNIDCSNHYYFHKEEKIIEFDINKLTFYIDESNEYEYIFSYTDELYEEETIYINKYRNIK